MSEKSGAGSIMWTDLTVENAERIRDFYGAVVGWIASGVDMGGYYDFNMNDPETGKPVAGVCHGLKPTAKFKAPRCGGERRANG